MAEAHKPVRVAVNVMRARQTVVGFNIAVLSIQIAQMARLPGGLKVSGIEHAVHLRADLALFIDHPLLRVAARHHLGVSLWPEQLAGLGAPIARSGVVRVKLNWKPNVFPFFRMQVEKHSGGVVVATSLLN